MSRNAEPAGSVYVVQVAAHDVVSYAISPIDDLSGMQPEREPVPGLSGDLLAEDDQ
jgi:hypothetical protein